MHCLNRIMDKACKGPCGIPIGSSACPAYGPIIEQEDLMQCLPMTSVVWARSIASCARARNLSIDGKQRRSLRPADSLHHHQQTSPHVSSAKPLHHNIKRRRYLCLLKLRLNLPPTHDPMQQSHSPSIKSQSMSCLLVVLNSCSSKPCRPCRRQPSCAHCRKREEEGGGRDQGGFQQGQLGRAFLTR